SICLATTSTVSPLRQHAAGSATIASCSTSATTTANPLPRPTVARCWRRSRQGPPPSGPLLRPQTREGGAGLRRDAGDGGVCEQPALGHDARDKRGRRAIEIDVSWRNAGDWLRQQLVRRHHFERQREAWSSDLERLADGVDRDTSLARQQRQRIGADLVDDRAVGAHAVGTDDHYHRLLNKDATGCVWHERHLPTGVGKRPCCCHPLAARPRLAHDCVPYAWWRRPSYCHQRPLDGSRAADCVDRASEQRPERGLNGRGALLFGIENALSLLSHARDTCAGVA